jgi:hypothetical protein
VCWRTPFASRRCPPGTTRRPLWRGEIEHRRLLLLLLAVVGAMTPRSAVAAVTGEETRPCHRLRVVENPECLRPLDEARLEAAVAIALAQPWVPRAA